MFQTSKSPFHALSTLNWVGFSLYLSLVIWIIGFYPFLIEGAFSAAKWLPHTWNEVNDYEHGWMVPLLSVYMLAQFEAGKEKVGKKGVVREPEIHQEVLDDFVALTKEIGFTILGMTFSPVKGPEGNIEFLAHLTLDDKPGIKPDTEDIVAQAHNTLKG